MTCRNCIVSMELQVGNFTGYNQCEVCETMQDNYTVTDAHDVLDLSDELKTLIMGIDRRRVKHIEKNESFLNELLELELIESYLTGDRIELSKKGCNWLSYLVGYDKKAYKYWMGLNRYAL